MSWSARWRELFDDRDVQVARRLAQGVAWHRSGRVTQITTATGMLTGRVQGSRATPYLVEVTLPPLDEASWAHVVTRLAAEVRHGARLLAGHAPEGLDAELDADGIPMFPSVNEVDLTCVCDDPVIPCAHVAGVWESVAERLDDDPFLLFRLRGRGREQLLAELSAARRQGIPADGRDTPLPLAELDAAGWHRARSNLAAVPIPEPEPPASSAAPLRVLGDPPGWAGGVSAWDLFRPLVERAAVWEPADDGPEG